MAAMDFFLRPEFMALTIFVVVVAFSIMIARSLSRKLDKRRRYHPVAGTIFNQLLNFPRLHDYMTDLASRYKTYRLITPFRSEIYTSDPVNIEYILKTNFPNYAKGWHNHSILKDLLGDGIFTVDGDKWREQRKVSSHEFSARALREVSAVVFKENAVKLAGVVSEFAISGQPFDIQELLMRSALDSIFRVAFGSDLDSICGSDEEGVRFSRAFDAASEITAWRYVDILWRIKKAMNLGLEAKLKENVRVVDEFVYKLIHTKMQQNSEHQCKQDILSRFLNLSEADPKYLRDVVLNFVMAGKDTTATTLSFKLLCQRPSDCILRFQPYAMGRMRFIWGEDAGEFRPERWLDDNGCFRPENPFKFTAFQVTLPIKADEDTLSCYAEILCIETE